MSDIPPRPAAPPPGRPDDGARPDAEPAPGESPGGSGAHGEAATPPDPPRQDHVGSDWSHGLRLAVGTLSVIPVRVGRVDRRAAGRAMLLAPAVALVLAGIAGLVLCGALKAGTGPLTAAVLAVAALAALTRGLHLDGLADVADGLGSNKPAPEALRIMKASDIGPFGVVTLLFVLLLDVATLSRIAAGDHYAASVAAVAVAAATGRTAIGIGCLDRVPSARPGGLGAMVAGTVGRRALVVPVLAVAAGAGALAGLRGVLAVALGLAAATLLLAHTVRRFGGITGDVLGALTEVAGAVALLVLSTQ